MKNYNTIFLFTMLLIVFLLICLHYKYKVYPPDLVARYFAKKPPVPVKSVYQI